MATKFGYKRDAVRVKAMKIDGRCLPDTRKFSVDPEITTHEVLRSILTKAFELNQDFTILYRVLDDYDQETYLPLLSDWDLDAAFVSAAEPCLCLRVEMKNFENVRVEWVADANTFSWITESKIPLRLQGLIMNNVEKTVNIVRGAFNFIDDVQQTQAASNFSPRAPLTDAEFRTFLDPVGQLMKPKEFRNAIYFGGVEPSLRKVVWRHLLNVYPSGLSGKQRIEYMKKKSLEYEQLKLSWKNIKNDRLENDLAYITGMVKKDVLRTDRQHHFYAGNDENQNIVSLFNILTTYALNHPSVSYCQGMSDLASPLLVTMGNEAHAYVCFCSLMRRLSSNFLIDGVTMTRRFQHLSLGLLYHDPVFFAYLKTHQADDLLFCYRWLLLEMKREFAFDDALRMLEVMWSSLPSVDPPSDLPLFEVRFCSESQFLSPTNSSSRQTPYTKVCALRRQPFRKKLILNRSLDESVIARRRLSTNFNGLSKKFSSFDDNAFYGNDNSGSAENGLGGRNEACDNLTSSSCSYGSSCSDTFCEKDDSETGKRVKVKNSELLNNSCESNSASAKIVKNLNEFLTLEKKVSTKRKKLDDSHSPENVKLEDTPSPESRIPSSLKNNDELVASNDNSLLCTPSALASEKCDADLENIEKRVFDFRLDVVANRNNPEEVFIWENPLREDVRNSRVEASEIESAFNQDDSSEDCLNAEFLLRDNAELDSLKFKDEIRLPGPKEFGGGNPFLMFLCIAVLCQHRDTVIKTRMDYNEIAMHFDKMVRKHNVVRVLNQARIMYSAYLKSYRETFLDV